MAFLRSTGFEFDAEIRCASVLLRPPSMRDYSAWAQLRAQSRAYLTVWEPQWARDELSRSAFRRRLRQQVGRPAETGRFRGSPVGGAWSA